ncbi:MAG: C10 family peptidase [Bacteroidales bacterium]|nr:C10 family peptidase [Bacteroidales bacterium]
MRKSIITLAACLLALCAAAAPVGKGTAERAARSFLANTLQLKGDVALLPLEWDYSNMYLFGFGQGFIIVPADDVARPVLAYSLNGQFDPSRISPTLQGWLDIYEGEIDLARRDDLPSDPAWGTLLANESLLKGVKEVPAAVGPLVTTQWGQYSPYNGMCPGGVPSGCVATATSQVMRYWNYPAFGQGSHSYNCATFGNLAADFAHTRYDWAHMPETGGSSNEERTALATLTFHVGVSVNMDYNYNQSGATTGSGDNCALEALKRYFHYNRSDINYRSKGNTSDDAWAEFLRTELRLLRPIMYDGTAGAFGGHSFICDGYDSLGMMHFNLGEFGEGDGFYSIGGIVYQQYNLNGNNSAITGIHPEYGLYVSDSVLTYHRNGGDNVIWVMTCDTTSLPWSATTSESWISLSGIDFDHLGAITVTLAENNSGSERTGTVTLQQGNLSTSFLVKQAAFDPEDYCNLTVLMESSRNQAWSNGAHLSFQSPEGLVYATTAHTANGSTSTASVSVAPRNVVVKWVAGGPLDRYYNYAVVNPEGDTLIKVNNAYYNGGEVLLEHPCSSVATPQIQRPEPSILIRPNPAHGFVEILCEEPIRQLSVHNIAGRQVHTGIGHTLDTREWPAGIYTLTVTTDNGSTSRQLIIK